MAHPIIVIKCGGAAMVESAEMQAMMEDIAALYHSGIRPVIVHGGGPEISRCCEQMGLPVKFVAGQRYTDAPTLEIAQMVLFGKSSGFDGSRCCVYYRKTVEKCRGSRPGFCR
jgi:acetylglutamate kinase